MLPTDHLKTVRAGLYELYDAALSAGDRNGGALLAGKLHENLHAVARITGELANPQTGGFAPASAAIS